MRWVTILAIEEKIAWMSMGNCPHCTICKGFSTQWPYPPICQCKCPKNWVYPHEISDMLRLVREGKLPNEEV